MNIDLNNLDGLFTDSLSNIEVVPSTGVKESIKKGMFYHNLMKNIYFLMGSVAFISIIVTSFVWYFAFYNLENEKQNNSTNIAIVNNNSTSNNINNSTINKKKIADSSLNKIKTNNNSNNVLISDNIEDSKQVKEFNITEKVSSVNKQTNNKVLTQNLVKSNKINEKNTNINDTKINVASNNNKSNNFIVANSNVSKNKPNAKKNNTRLQISNNNKIIYNNAVISKKENNNSLIVLELNNSSTNKLLVDNKQSEEKENISIVALQPVKYKLLENNIVASKIKAKQYKTNNNSTFNTKTNNILLNKQTYNTISVNKAVNILNNTKEAEKLYEQLLFNYLNNKRVSKTGIEEISFVNMQIPDDTVAYDVNNKPIVLPSHRWYVDLILSPNYSSSQFINNNSEVLIAEKLNNETNATFGFGTGLSAGYKFKNFAINLGVLYSEFNQKFNAKYNQQEITNTNFYNYNTTTEWEIETTFYWNLDSLIQGDSVLTPIIDSTQTVLTDSTLETRIDTSLAEKTVLKTNKYKYVELPLTIEYVFNRGKKLSPFVNGGLITGLLIKTQSYTYQNANGEIIEDATTPYIKPNFWLIFGAGVRYNVNDKYSLMLSPYYRYNLKPIIAKSHNYGQKINVWGVNFSIRYTF